MTRRTRFALAAIPAVFFSFVILVGCNIISMATGQYDGALAALGYFITFYGNGILGTISLMCLYLFLKDTKETNPAWYLGIPLGIAITVVTLAGFIVPILRSGTGSPPIFETGAWMTFLLLPVFCALFFWSLRRESSWIPAYAAVALIISILSFIVVYDTLFPAWYAQGEIRAGGSPSEGWALLYLLFGLPLTGLFFPAIARGSTSRGSDPAVNTRDRESNLP